jgi:hypothetical protein
MVCNSQLLFSYFIVKELWAFTDCFMVVEKKRIALKNNYVYLIIIIMLPKIILISGHQTLV